MKVTKEGRNEQEIIIMKKQKLQRRKEKLKEKGITLIALVVTIVILLILAGVTLNIALGQNGLFSRAQNAADRYKSAQENEESMLAELGNQLVNLTNNQTKNPPKTVKEAKEREYEFENTTTVTDEKGNEVVVPGEFHISSESGDTVQDGIIIEDDEGNQFVWIPVSNIDGDNNEKTSGEEHPEQKEEDLIVLSDETKVEITLGRYTFDTNNGNPDLKQAGKDYEKTITVDSYYQETSTHTNGGVGAKDLGKFVESVKKNHGYYFARYEASFGSGDTPTKNNSSASIMIEQKPQVKKSTKYNSNSMSYETGTLWIYITQTDASKVSQNMYKTSVDNEAGYVESDLVNSYAWDTAIVYIQKMGNENYANATSATNGNTGTLKNTGETEDEKCHIYDMAGNLLEWNTEYCSYNVSGNINPCTMRGGVFGGTKVWSGKRSDDDANYNAIEGHRFSPAFVFKINQI